MIKSKVFLAMLSICILGTVTPKMHGAQVIKTMAASACHLGSKISLSPQRTVSLINLLLKSKTPLRTASLIGGAAALLVGFYNEKINPPQYWFNDSYGLEQGAQLGCLIPLITYLGLELTLVPTVGFLTMHYNENRAFPLNEWYSEFWAFIPPPQDAQKMLGSSLQANKSIMKWTAYASGALLLGSAGVLLYKYWLEHKINKLKRLNDMRIEANANLNRYQEDAATYVRQEKLKILSVLQNSFNKAAKALNKAAPSGSSSDSRFPQAVNLANTPVRDVLTFLDVPSNTRESVYAASNNIPYYSTYEEEEQRDKIQRFSKALVFASAVIFFGTLFGRGFYTGKLKELSLS